MTYSPISRPLNPTPCSVIATRKMHSTLQAMSPTTPAFDHESEKSSEKSFSYQPLDLLTDSIRLIRVLPSRSDQGILKLDLWHSNVMAGYQCISYQWGPLSRLQRVLINDQTFTVGENLYAFLKEVYIWTQRGFDDPLWIDAVCIDQGCTEERGHQVQRMGTIYSKAQEVLVWLGDHGPLVDTFQDWLPLARNQPCPTHLRQQWKSIRLNAYWQRAWIKQEILLAEKVSIVFRGARIEWPVLGGAISRSGDIDRLEDEHAAHLWTFWDERWMCKQTRKEIGKSPPSELFTFWSLMHTHRHAGCVDKRDRVYSLLGLVDQDHGFAVNYNEDVADLFWRVAEHFDVGQSPELIDILRVALLEDDQCLNQGKRGTVNPMGLCRSIFKRPDTHVGIPIRRITSTDSIVRRVRASATCSAEACKHAPRMRCGRDDLLLCTNAPVDEPSAHGCIHAIAHPLDKPAAEPFEIRLVAHHNKQKATTTLSSTAVEIYDAGTDTWSGISTWSSLQKAADAPNLDRTDRARLRVPATYAMMIWFGVHPDQLDNESFLEDTGLQSAHNALPVGTKITKNMVEFPGS